jgi:ABC-type uncharacterized transport system permease subunit
MTGVLTELLAGCVAFAIPLFLAASGELVSQRAGVLNLSLEGMILSGAFAGAAAAGATGSAIVGVLAAVLIGLLIASVQAFLSITLHANQLITGIAANALALGATSYGARLLASGDTLRDVPGFSSAGIPVLRDLPLVGAAIFGQTVMAYIGVALAVTLALLTLRRRAVGLVIDAVGEEPAVADHAGVRVDVVRWGGVLVAGGMAGLAGAQLALSELHGFSENMTAGMGYVAVVAVIAGAWRPGRLAVACIIFGFAQALQFTAPTIGLDVPVAVLVMSPYIVALVAISGFAGARRGPAGLSRPFVRAG